MAVTYTKLPFSASTNGRLIAVADTSSPGTLIHTATNTSGVIDEIVLHLYNGHTSDVLVTIEYGGTTSADQMPFMVPFKKPPYYVIPAFVLRGGLELRIFAATTNVILVGGSVNRRTET